MPKDEKLLAIRSHWMEKWRKRNCFLSIDFKDIFRLRQPFSPCAAVRLRCGLLSCVHKEKKAKEKSFSVKEREEEKKLPSEVELCVTFWLISSLTFFLRDSATIRIYKTFLSTSCARARVSRSFSVWFVCCCFYFSLFLCVSRSHLQIIHTYLPLRPLNNAEMKALPCRLLRHVLILLMVLRLPMTCSKLRLETKINLFLIRCSIVNSACN